MTRKFMFFAVSLIVVAFFGWCYFVAPSHRILVLSAYEIDPVSVRVPSGFRVRVSHDQKGNISEIRLLADAELWAREARKQGCEGDPEEFVMQAKRVRPDLSLALIAWKKLTLGKLFESRKKYSPEEMSVVSWDGSDLSHPRNFVLDLTKQLKTDRISFASCYYSSMPNWYCEIYSRLNANIVGTFGIPKGLSPFWSNSVAIMRCAADGMMKASDLPESN